MSEETAVQVIMPDGDSYTDDSVELLNEIINSKEIPELFGNNVVGYIYEQGDASAADKTGIFKVVTDEKNEANYITIDTKRTSKIPIFVGVNFINNYSDCFSDKSEKPLTVNGSVALTPDFGERLEGLYRQQYNPVQFAVVRENVGLGIGVYTEDAGNPTSQVPPICVKVLNAPASKEVPEEGKANYKMFNMANSQEGEVPQWDAKNKKLSEKMQKKELYNGTYYYTDFDMSNGEITGMTIKERDITCPNMLVGYITGNKHYKPNGVACIPIGTMKHVMDFIGIKDDDRATHPLCTNLDNYGHYGPFLKINGEGRMNADVEKVWNSYIEVNFELGVDNSGENPTLYVIDTMNDGQRYVVWDNADIGDLYKGDNPVIHLAVGAVSRWLDNKESNTNNVFEWLANKCRKLENAMNTGISSVERAAFGAKIGAVFAKVNSLTEKSDEQIAAAAYNLYGKDAESLSNNTLFQSFKKKLPYVTRISGIMNDEEHFSLRFYPAIPMYVSGGVLKSPPVMKEDYIMQFVPTYTKVPENAEQQEENDQRILYIDSNDIFTSSHLIYNNDPHRYGQGEISNINNINYLGQVSAGKSLHKVIVYDNAVGKYLEQIAIGQGTFLRVQKDFGSIDGFSGTGTREAYRKWLRNGCSDKESFTNVSSCSLLKCCVVVVGIILLVFFIIMVARKVGCYQDNSFFNEDYLIDE